MYIYIYVYQAVYLADYALSLSLSLSARLAQTQKQVPLGITGSKADPKKMANVLHDDVATDDPTLTQLLEGTIDDLEHHGAFMEDGFDECLFGSQPFILNRARFLPIHGAISRKRLRISWDAKVYNLRQQEQNAEFHQQAQGAPKAGKPRPGSGANASTPQKTRQQISELSSKERTEARDKWAVCFLHDTADLKEIFGSYREAVSALKSMWRSLPDVYKRDWIKHWLNPEQCPHPQFPTVEEVRGWRDKDSSIVPASASMPFHSDAVDDKEFVEAVNSRVRGYMLTWHGRWGVRYPPVRELMATCAGMPWRAAVEVIKASPFYMQLQRVAHTFTRKVDQIS